jgi:hypothetical protein
MAKLSWSIDNVIAGDRGDLPTFRAGEAGTFQFVFQPSDDASAGHRERHDALVDRNADAGEFERFELARGEHRYAALGPADPLVGITVTGPDPATVGRPLPRAWAVLQSVADTTPDGAGVRFADVDVRFLARYDRFADRADARATLEATLQVA